MKVSAIVFGLAIPLLMSAPFAPGIEGALVRSAQAQGNAFDGHWVGSGHNARITSKNRCGDGPLVDLTIHDGKARAVFKLTVRQGLTGGLKTHVISLDGRVDGGGRLVLAENQSHATANLSASLGSGEGTWEIGSLACEGTFRVRRKP